MTLPPPHWTLSTRGLDPAVFLATWPRLELVALSSPTPGHHHAPRTQVLPDTPTTSCCLHIHKHTHTLKAPENSYLAPVPVEDPEDGRMRLIG